MIVSEPLPLTVNVLSPDGKIIFAYLCVPASIETLVEPKATTALAVAVKVGITDIPPLFVTVISLALDVKEIVCVVSVRFKANGWQ